MTAAISDADFNDDSEETIIWMSHYSAALESGMSDCVASCYAHEQMEDEDV